MRATLAVLLVLLCAGAAPADPADTVPFDHWAYDAVVRLDDALQGTLLEPWEARQPRTLSRYEFAVLGCTALKKLRDSDIIAAEAASRQLGENWRKLALEFLPELQDLCADTVFQERDLPDAHVPTAGSRLGDIAVLLNALPADHWLYPEVLRVVWAAPPLGRNMTPPRPHSPADSVPPNHWAYHAMSRLMPIAHSLTDRTFSPDHPPTRYEAVIGASEALRELSKIDSPTPEQEGLALTSALLALEFWEDMEELAEDVEYLLGIRPAERSSQYPLRQKAEEIGEEHWLHPIIMRTLEIGRRNG